MHQQLLWTEQKCWEPALKHQNRSVKVVCYPSNETHMEPVPRTLQYRNMQISSDKFNCDLSFVTFKVLRHVVLVNQKLTVSGPPQNHAVSRGEKGAPTWLFWMFRSNTLSYAPNRGWLVFVCLYCFQNIKYSIGKAVSSSPRNSWGNTAVY